MSLLKRVSIHDSRSSGWWNFWQGERGGWWKFPLTLLLVWTFETCASIPLGVLDHSVKDTASKAPLLVSFCYRMTLDSCLALFSILGLFLGVRLIHRVRFYNLVSNNCPYDWALGFKAAFVWGILWGGQILIIPGQLAQVKHQFAGASFENWVFIVPLIVFLASIQAASEELYFRGYILTRITAWLKRPWIGIFVSALMFAALHSGQFNHPMRVEITIAGLFFAASAFRANTLSPAIGAHTMHNALNVLWLPENTIGNATWLQVAVLLGQFSVWYAWLHIVTRSRR